jgi:hypothetical protein
MRSLLIFILLSNAFLLFSQEKQNKIANFKYIEAYHYLSNDSTLNNRIIKVSNKVAPLDFSIFWEFFKKENDSFYTISTELDSISRLPCNNCGIYVNNKVKCNNRPTALVFFSKIYKNTLMAEVFVSNIDIVEYSKVKSLNTGHVFLFVFNGDILEKVLKEEIAYE